MQKIWMNPRNLLKSSNISRFTDKERTLYRRKDIGFVFQFYNFIPTLTAYENVDMVSKSSDISISADEALGMVGLKRRRHRRKHLAEQHFLHKQAIEEEKQLEYLRKSGFLDGAEQRFVHKEPTDVLFTARNLITRWRLFR